MPPAQARMQRPVRMPPSNASADAPALKAHPRLPASCAQHNQNIQNIPHGSIENRFPQIRTASDSQRRARYSPRFPCRPPTPPTADRGSAIHRSESPYSKASGLSLPAVRFPGVCLRYERYSRTSASSVQNTVGAHRDSPLPGKAYMAPIRSRRSSPQHPAAPYRQTQQQIVQTPFRTAP